MPPRTLSMASFDPTRRDLLKFGCSAAALSLMPALFGGDGPADAGARPNILWLVSEDNSPWLGCYGVAAARTPTLDALAARGVRYTSACSNAAVCAPARNTIISGRYATSNGAQHMRSFSKLPDGVPYFPAWLRAAGYYCTNNDKEDYNAGLRKNTLPEELHQAWDESSRQAHWRNRPEGKPFFAVFNMGETHESQIMPRKRGDDPTITDPQAVDLPPYLPDHPVIRDDLAYYYDRHEAMDRHAKEILDQLQADGLADDTIVMYYGDHGGSMPRGKSDIYESGVRVPFILHVPERWQHLCPHAPGSVVDELIAFVDLAPTVLSLAGIAIPEYMQGLVFLGPERPEALRQYNYSFRGRRGDGYDIRRGVHDGRWKYIRNYSPHVPTMQYNAYSWNIRSYGVWREAYEAGTLEPHQARFFATPKAPEELYDLDADPYELRNLASEPAHADKLAELRAANDAHILAIRDTGFYPEGLVWNFGPGGRHDSLQESDYPLTRLLPLANAASDQDPANLPSFVTAMTDEDPGMRWWGAMGCVYLREAAAPAREALLRTLDDDNTLVRVAAAEAAALIGMIEEARPAFAAGLADDEQFVALQTIRALEHLGDTAALFKDEILAARNHQNRYVQRGASILAEQRGW